MLIDELGVSGLVQMLGQRHMVSHKLILILFSQSCLV